MPDPKVASGYREALSRFARFTVQDFGAGIVGVAPVEGPGADAPHFRLTRLCDAETDLEDPDVWKPLRDHPPRRRESLDADNYRADMLARGQEVRARDPASSQRSWRSR
jgi:hypothetical protein